MVEWCSQGGHLNPMLECVDELTISGEALTDTFIQKQYIEN